MTKDMSRTRMCGTQFLGVAWILQALDAKPFNIWVALGLGVGLMLIGGIGEFRND